MIIRTTSGMTLKGIIEGINEWEDKGWIDVKENLYKRIHYKIAIRGVLMVKRKGKHQGRVVELFPRSLFDVIQGCINSRPGRLGILEVTRTDRLGFSLCAVLLEITRSCVSKWHSQNCSRENGGLVYSRLEGGRGT